MSARRATFRALWWSACQLLRLPAPDHQRRAAPDRRARSDRPALLAAGFERPHAGGVRRGRHRGRRDHRGIRSHGRKLRERAKCVIALRLAPPLRASPASRRATSSSVRSQVYKDVPAACGSMVVPRPVGAVIDVDHTVRCCPVDTMDFIDVLDARCTVRTSSTERAPCAGSANATAPTASSIRPAVLRLGDGCRMRREVREPRRACNGCRGLSPDANLEGRAPAVSRAGVDPDDFDEALALFNQVERVQSARE